MSHPDTKSVAKGVSILGITGIICKLVGVLFSIPLNMISTEIATVFYVVYPTYTLLLTISSAGLPVAVSRMVAGFLARSDARNARNTFRVALLSLFSVGAVFSLLMVVLNSQLTAMVNVEEASLGFYAIAPCVLIVCVLSAFRGFIQGQQNMFPTAISQLIEQVGKVVVSLPLAYIGIHHYHSVTYGAAGALFGITVAEFAALIYMLVRTRIHRNDINRIPQAEEEKLMENKTLLRRLVTISIPITISACIIPLSTFIDSAMMIDRMMVAGLAKADAKSAYGIYTSVVIRLINIPTALALAISMSLVPVISARRSVNDIAGIHSESNTGMRYAFLIGFPCSVGMSLLSREIVSFFYGDVASFSAAQIQLASELLTFSAMTVVLFTAVQATSSILQGIRKQKIPMYTMMAGVAVKIVLNYTLIGTKGIDIHGGPIASIACYSVAMILNFIFMCRHARMPFNWKDWVLKPGLASALMGVAVYGAKLILPSGRLWTILEIILGVVVFLGSAFLLKAVTKDDLRAMARRSKS
ncbi:MAG: polysaccharide biosynthesis protein [Clostridiales bacterium]|nr:polysaccharide biosynthesis protein [Clostridiales bacterium]